jgi:nicotinamide riboside kinase
MHVNSFVDQINEFHPFSATAGIGFTELRRGFFDAPTRLDAKLEDMVRCSETRLIFLTGNAGQGKTFLCRKLLERLDMGEEESDREIVERCDGSFVNRELEGGRKLRIIKDLSEFTYENGARSLADAYSDPSNCTLVCANEGRLRAVILQLIRDGRRELGKAIEENREAGYDFGVLSKSSESDILIIDLNRQTLVSKENSFLENVIENFCCSQRWEPCRSCSASEFCPILRNRNYWAEEESEENKKRRKGFEYIISVLECSNVVITKRNLLEVVSWMFTGNLDCRKISEMEKQDLQSSRYRSHQLIYENEWIDPGFRQLPIIRDFRRFDPGMHAHLERDEKLIATLLIKDPSLEKPFGSRSETRSVGKKIRNVLRELRREDFFDGFDEEKYRSMKVGPLGLKYRNEFFGILKEDGDPSLQRRTRDTLASGLEHFQGLWRKDSESDPQMCLVDPSFLIGRSSVSIISSQVIRGHLSLLSQDQYWRKFGPQGSKFYGDVLDWNSRTVRILMGSTEQISGGMELDLISFEFLCRLSSGLSTKGEYLATFNHVEDILMKWSVETSKGNEDGIITVCVEGQLRRLFLDESRIREL